MANSQSKNNLENIAIMVMNFKLIGEMLGIN